VVGANNLPGVIESSIFIGDSIEYEVRLENDGTILTKSLLSDAIKIHTAGQHVIVSFPLEKGYIFPYPAMGLLKEVEVI
jgi:hypothetical protein